MSATGVEREPYADRYEAGDALADVLRPYAGRDDVVVLGLPRGGVPVASRIASALQAPMDMLVVRKLGLPGHPELAMGAIASVGGALQLVRNEDVLASAGPSEDQFQATCRREEQELHRRELVYRGARPPIALRGRVAIVVDDGLATGATMRAAVAALRDQGPSRLVVAVPIASQEACQALAAVADEIACPWMPRRFYAVGQGYADFRPTEDAEVVRLMA